MATPRKKPEERLKMGRPTDYTPELAEHICELLATNDTGLSELCRTHDELPDEGTIRRWMYRNPDFRSSYMRARIAQVDLLAEKSLDVANNDANDTTINAQGDTVGLSVTVARDRLKLDTRRWLASKLMPKLYGNEIELANEKEKNARQEAELIELRAKLDEANRRDY
jgi:hypothetical protein